MSVEIKLPTLKVVIVSQFLSVFTQHAGQPEMMKAEVFKFPLTLHKGSKFRTVLRMTELTGGSYNELELLFRCNTNGSLVKVITLYIKIFRLI